MRNASGHQCKVKMSGSEKKVNENTYDISPLKLVTKKFLDVSRNHVVVVQNAGKEMYKKRVLHVQSCFFLLISPKVRFLGKIQIWISESRNES